MGTATNIVVPLVVAIVAGIVGVSLLTKRNPLPDHLLNHPLVDLPNFFTEKEVDELLEFTRYLHVMPPIAREYDSYTPLTDNIGEAVPYVKGQPCPLYLIPNGAKTHCIFPGRIDVGRHLIQSGGPTAAKEKYGTLVSRVFGFMKYIYNYTEYPLPTRLLSEPKFQKLAKDVCPTDRKHLDPIQVNLVVQLPGQTVATHIDAPYFWRASRFHYPIWYLAVMMFSGLFQDQFVNQVQVVGYYHKWTDTNRSGVFKFWNSKDPVPQLSFPVSRSANAVDGSKVVHAADFYMPHVRPPTMPDSTTNILRFNKETKAWDLVSDDTVLKSYPEDDIRFSVVYRARCFRDEEERLAYHKAQDNPMTLDEINARFYEDLYKRGVLPQGKKLAPYELGTLLLDTYVKYPISHDALIPWNYCAIDRLFPKLKPVVDLLCS